jgi:pimeloyl-ACP methyl ester carboxylesterase
MSSSVYNDASFAHGCVLCASRSDYQLHRLAFTDWGAPGERGTVVCVHGLTRQGRDFDFLAKALAAEGYRVICPDLVGRGLSDRLSRPEDYDLPQYVLDMTTLLASIGATSVNWIGCSLGGLIGIVLAGMPNSPIGRLLVNDIGPEMPVSAVLRINRYVRNGPERFASVENADLYFRDILSPFGTLTDAEWAHLAAHSVMPDGNDGYRFRFDRMIVRGFRPPWQYTRQLWSLWDQIESPTLLLRGADSDLLLQSTAEKMIDRNANAELLVVPDCGHLPPLLNDQQVRLVADWVNGRNVGLRAGEPLFVRKSDKTRAPVR